MMVHVLVCNVPPLPDRARLHLAAFIGHRLPSQTNTSLFCTFCPHSCAIGKNFPIGHPSLNCSKLSTLNLRVLSRLASGKEVATYMSILLILLSPRLGCHTLTPLREIDAPVDQPRPGTSPLGHVHVSNASACAMLCDHSGSTPAMHTMPAQLQHTRP